MFCPLAPSQRQDAEGAWIVRKARLVIGVAVFLFGVLGATAGSGSSWQRPPQEILDVLHAPEPPMVSLSPTSEVLALLQPRRYPPIADLARPMLRLAGTRITPQTNGRRGEGYMVALTLKQVADGREQPITLPADPRISQFRWSADGRRFCFLNQVADAIELWVGETASGRITLIPGLKINPVLFWEVTWMPDQTTLLVKRIPPERGAPPEKPLVPPGPDVQDCAGQSASSTYEARDVLTGPYDEDLFAFYALSQLALVDTRTGQVTPVGEPGIIAGVQPAPDGQRILVETIRKPWSYRHAWQRFPKDVEVWNLAGKVEHLRARLPLADQVPIHGVPEGPRDYSWRPTEPATLIWSEALDGGDPSRKVSHRDRIMMQKAPFTTQPRELYKAPHRVDGWWWSGNDDRILVSEYERERRWRYVWAVHADARRADPRILFDLSANERYLDPGSPVLRRRPDGAWVLAQDGDAIFLEGDGATLDGDRPFLDRFSLRTRKSERLFRCGPTDYESFMGWLDLRTHSYLTRRESPTEVPNYLVRALTRRLPEPAEGGGTGEGGKGGEAQWESSLRPLTNFTDPTPQIRAISKRIVTYQRADGTPLSFTLYLPPGYQEGTRLPTVLEAYPLEYSDPGTAGQVAGTDRAFTQLTGPTPLFFLLDGYAVLESASMPVIGDPDTAYDTFIEQLAADARAAIAKAVEIGVTDSQRVGIIGHSHGALMTATLLAHSDLFRSGIARSGAYNHTIRPFGFQSERRTLWQAPETYLKISPLMYADKINEPILLIHGESDQNPGTVPYQSEKLFEAIRGTGGTARLIMLPFESHGYQSQEAVEDVLAEQLAWFDRYVKNAKAR
jgi:dipeptidyl aminopeptidase/acylaminoacyl peptidase